MCSDIVLKWRQIVYGSVENEDPENEDPLKNEDPLEKKKEEEEEEEEKDVNT